MPTGINFAPSSSPHHKRGKSGDIEYSSVQDDEPKVTPVQPQPVEPVHAEVPSATLVAQQPAQPQQPKPKKTHSFFSWRKRRNEESTQSIAQHPQVAPAAQIHTAPQHQKESARTDLLHGVLGVAEPKKQIPAAAAAPVQMTAQAPVHTLPPTIPLPDQPQIQQQVVVVPKLSRKEQKERLVDELPVTEVNLIPDVVLSEMEKHHGIRDLCTIALILIALVLTVYGGLKIYERKITSDTVAVETDITSLNTQIAAYQETQNGAQDISDRLLALDRVMQAHVYWTPFLSTVESLTLPTVYYTSMTGSAASLSFTFDAVAESYSQIAPQVELFRQSPFVTKVNISSTQLFQPSSVISSTSMSSESTGGVSFKMTVEFAPDIFIHPQLRSYAQN